MKRIFIIYLVVIFSLQSVYCSFVKIPIDIQGGAQCKVLTLDFDNDGYMDVLVTGSYKSEEFSYTGFTHLYKNNGDSTFVLFQKMLDGISNSMLCADFNNDNRIDIIISGNSESENTYKTVTYRNAGNGNFVEVENDIRDKTFTLMEYADLDNDGDYDIVTYTESGTTELFVNEGDFNFLKAKLNMLNNFRDGNFKIIDLDNDGFQDVIFSGDIAEAAERSLVNYIYKNKGNFVFERITLDNIDIAGYIYPFNVDGDKDIDFIINGIDQYDRSKTNLYVNEGNFVFSEVDTVIPSFYAGGISTGDFNHDNIIDVAVTGMYFKNITGVYTNMGEYIFSAEESSFDQISYGPSILFDMNNDKNLDVLMIGLSDEAEEIPASRLYINQEDIDTSFQSTPDSLQVVISEYTKLLWKMGDEDSSCTYNIKVRNSRDTVVSPMANDVGARHITSVGNAGINNFYLLQLSAGKYFWSVQKIDARFQGSAFSIEDTFLINPTSYFSELPDTALVQETISITYTGNVDKNGKFTWSFDGAETISNQDDKDFEVSWETTGLKTITCVTSIDSMVSDTTKKTIFVKEKPLNISNNSINQDDLVLYPNPTSGKIYIEGNNNNGMKISIYELNGREIVEKLIFNNELDISFLKNGFYFIKIETIQATYYRKISKY